MERNVTSEGNTISELPSVSMAEIDPDILGKDHVIMMK